MVKYLVIQIIKEKLDYNRVIENFPQYKEDIDKSLILEGRTDLITK